MNYIEYDGWNSPKSTITIEEDENGFKHFSGVYYLFEISFKFSIIQQKNSRYLARGYISPISPETGHIWQIPTKKQNATIRKLEAKDPDFLLKNAGKRITQFNIHREISMHSISEDDVKCKIKEHALKIYEEYGSYFRRIQGKIARPDTIDPFIAVSHYADDYLNINHPNISPNTHDKYKNDLLRVSLMLPNIPMKDFDNAIMTKSLKPLLLSKTKIRLLKSFWLYAYQKRIYAGKFPFPPEEKKRKAPEYHIKKKLLPDHLSIKEMDDIFDKIMSNPDGVSGPHCGTALQLWAGYSANQATSFLWKDVIFDENDPSYVRIKYRRDELAGYTHNYTAPIFPAGALILNKRFKALQYHYKLSRSKLMDMPIVSTVSDPAKALSPNVLTQFSNSLLRSIGLSYEMFHRLRLLDPSVSVSSRLLKNTYAFCVNVLCALEKEEGKAKFLQHLSLEQNTSDDHYTSFTCDEAGRHLAALMSAVQPDFELNVYITPTTISNNREVHIINPESTTQRAGYVGSYKLAPGEEIMLLCKHGVKGNVVTRGYNDKGTLRRKQRTKKDADS